MPDIIYSVATQTYAEPKARGYVIVFRACIKPRLLRGIHLKKRLLQSVIYIVC